MEIDIKVLTKCEKEIFSELSDTCSRFSKFEADIANYPETYLSEEQLRKKVETALKELNEELGLNWYDFGARNYDASLGLSLIHI